MAQYKKGAQDRSAVLVFLDEAGFSERPPVRRTWAKRGVTPIIRHHFNWSRINTIGAITCKPDGSNPGLLLHLQRTSISKESIVAFLEALHKEVAGQIVLLWDGLPAHKSIVVKEHILTNKDWLTVERLPAYAPEINPVEYLWAAFKNKDVANFCCDSIDQVQCKLILAAERVQNTKTLLTGFLRKSGLFGDTGFVT